MEFIDSGLKYASNTLPGITDLSTHPMSRTSLFTVTSYLPGVMCYYKGLYVLEVEFTCLVLRAATEGCVSSELSLPARCHGLLWRVACLQSWVVPARYHELPARCHGLSWRLACPQSWVGPAWCHELPSRCHGLSWRASCSRSGVCLPGVMGWSDMFLLYQVRETFLLFLSESKGTDISKTTRKRGSEFHNSSAFNSLFMYSWSSSNTSIFTDKYMCWSCFLDARREVAKRGFRNEIVGKQVSWRFCMESCYAHACRTCNSV